MTHTKTADLSIPHVIELAREYIERKGLRQRDFACRVGYSLTAVQSFLTAPGKYTGNEQALAAAMMKLIGAPDDEDINSDAPLFQTDNFKLIKQHFTEALAAAQVSEEIRGFYFRGAPGSQKTFVLKRLSRELNLAQAHLNGSGSRSYYVRCRYGLSPRNLMMRICIAIGSPATGDTERLLNSLKFHLRTRHCIIILDEAQGLTFACLEIVRDLLDELPRCAILFAGSHELEDRFAKLNMQQWHSRIRKGTALPGVREDEAKAIIKSVLGEVPAKSAAALISGSYDRDLYNGKVVKYVSMRKLVGALTLIKSRQDLKAKAVSA